MPQVSAQEFERLPLRVHAFLEGVALHDVWAIDLPHARTGIRLADFIQATRGRVFGPSPWIVRALIGVRLALGRLFHWDHSPAREGSSQTFADRLTLADREKSLAPEGARDGAFRVVYRFEDEQLVEVANRTAHAAASSALVETPSTYRFYFAVYVRSVGKITPLYMAVIDPFRKLFVYPSLLRGVRSTWLRAFESAAPGGNGS